MKKIFTLLLMFVVAIGFAQRGSEISLQKEFKENTNISINQPTAKETWVVLPGNWAEVGTVGTYRWVDGETGMGWIFGNNAYDAYGGGMGFNAAEAYEVVGAYVWMGSVATGPQIIKFSVYEFADGVVGEVVATKEVALSNVTALPSADASPDDYVDAFYFEFDTPVLVEGDYFIGVDASAVTWTEHGDGLGISSGVIGAGGGGTGLAYIVDSEDGWVPATEWNAALDLDLGIFPVAQEPTIPGDDFEVVFNVDMTDVEGFDPAEHTVYLVGTITDPVWIQPGNEGSIEMELVGGSKETPTEVLYVTFGNAMPAGWQNVVIAGPDGFPGWEHTTEGGGYGGTMESTSFDDGFMILDSDAHGTGVDEEVDMITAPIDLSNAVSDVTFSVEHLARTYGYAEIYIIISTDDFDTEEVLYEWKDGEQHAYNTADGNPPVDPRVVVSTFDITDIAAGESNVKIKFKWIGAFDYWWLVDDVKITAVLEDQEPPEELIYTATVMLEAGTYQYKYFSDAIGEGWDGGEWEGGNDRVIVVEGDMVQNDIFGGGISSEADILTFGFDEVDNDDILFEGSIIKVWVAVGTDITELTPTMTISEDAEIDYEYPTVMDFTDAVDFVVTAEDGTTKTWTVYVRFTSVEQNILSKLNVYPNPFSNEIVVNNAENVNRVVITNLIGQVVMDMPLTENRINTSNLSKGVYLVIFQAENGDRVVRKMVKN